VFSGYVGSIVVEVRSKIRKSTQPASHECRVTNSEEPYGFGLQVSLLQERYFVLETAFRTV